MVRYCPGSAPGSPAGMSLHDADAHMVKDTRYVQQMTAIDSIQGPVVYPHIGSCPPTCRYYREYQASMMPPEARGRGR